MVRIAKNAIIMNIAVFTPKGFEFDKSHVKSVRAVSPSLSISVARSEAELLGVLPEAAVLVCGNYNYDESWLGMAGKLKWIHSIAAGNERILPSLLGRQIMLTDSSGVHAIPIAEQVLAYMLMFERKLLAAVKSQERKEWAGSFGEGELCGKTALIVGLGSVGMGIARLCKAVGMKVIATKRTLSPAAAADAKGVVDLVKLLGKADYVVLSLPYTKETHHSFGSREFAAMKPAACFINIARGSVVDEAALIGALAEGKIAGAALDVFETEPLPVSSPLWEMENVIITPHNAGLTPRYMGRVVDIFCSNLKAYLENKPMPNLVDKGKGY